MHIAMWGPLHTIELGFYIPMMSLLKRALGILEQALHECSKYQKGVDQFDLYLASGLGTSPDKNTKETKCETLVDSCSQQPFFSLSS